MFTKAGNPPMNAHLHRLLDHLSATLDGCRWKETDTRYRRALNFEPVGRPPLVVTYPYPQDTPFQPYAHREIFADPEKMLLNELTHAFDTSVALSPKLEDDLPWTVRANFGTVLIASLFGACVEQVEDNPPWVVPKDDERISLEQIAETDPLDFSQG